MGSTRGICPYTGVSSAPFQRFHFLYFFVVIFCWFEMGSIRSCLPGASLRTPSGARTWSPTPPHAHHSPRRPTRTRLSYRPPTPVPRTPASRWRPRSLCPHGPAMRAKLPRQTPRHCSQLSLSSQRSVNSVVRTDPGGTQGSRVEGAQGPWEGGTGAIFCLLGTPLKRILEAEAEGSESTCIHARINLKINGL